MNNNPKHFAGCASVITILKNSYIDSLGLLHDLEVILSEDSWRKPTHISVGNAYSYKKHNLVKKPEKVLQIAKELYDNFVSGIESKIRSNKESEIRLNKVAADFPTAVKCTYDESWALVDKDEKNIGMAIKFRTFNDKYTIKEIKGTITSDHLERIFAILKEKETQKEYIYN